MQSTLPHISDLVSPNGDCSAMALPQVRALVERYPYYHYARLTLLRMLYQLRDPDFNNELRRSALYLPSRETIFEFAEGKRMKPSADAADSTFFGATQARKANGRLATVGEKSDDDRTETLIDTFLNRDNGPQTSTTSVPQRRGRADATVDYIAYMLAEEEAMTEEKPKSEAPDSMATEAVATASAETTAIAVERESQQSKIDNFIQNQGDRRIRLNDKKDSELQKPVLDVDNSTSQGAFTETLAKIYIKQGKFEHAIEIIRRLSLKYPKKNRYFADQIRFLEKLIANQQAMKR